MNYLCCPSCEVRFASGDAAYMSACPECGSPLTPVDDPRLLVGFRLFDPLDARYLLLDAVGASLLDPEPEGSRS